MTEKEWLEKASVFEMGICPFYKREVSIQKYQQIDNSYKWVVVMDSWVFGKDGEFHYQPMPSSRTKKFIQLTRFDSKEEAYDFWTKCLEETLLANRS